MPALFLSLGFVTGAISLGVGTNWPANPITACGFGIASGLCAVAAAISYAANTISVAIRDASFREQRRARNNDDQSTFV